MVRNPFFSRFCVSKFLRSIQTDRQTDLPRDTPSYRVACPGIKNKAFEPPNDMGGIKQVHAIRKILGLHFNPLGIPIPEGYEYDEESRRAFKLHNTKKNWQDAQQTCQMEGGNLVTVDTPKINNILKSKKKLMWIGASDLVRL